MKRARRFNLILDDVSITHVAFSPEFTHAVEGASRFAVLARKSGGNQAEQFSSAATPSQPSRSPSRSLSEPPSWSTRPSRKR